jgi:hypothetical protein
MYFIVKRISVQISYCIVLYDLHEIYNYNRVWNRLL